ncbi:MAG: UDP-N-acetylmuramoyl-L-alanyl-D-glutamate--2,6-diaminopimelate ligase, partial [Candidatus Dadabacteria bacterium]|nr:UDP-N-acetylmuramoyl-L-alanyl-D-glutamate--2,6-diaminopimelate ligase [Candidatus Dadabacteria bacterium]
DIEAGILEAHGDSAQYIKITDRYQAILKAVRIGSEKDTVLIAGKGHEDYQIIGNTTIHFDDREMCEKALEEAV